MAFGIRRQNKPLCQTFLGIACGQGITENVVRLLSYRGIDVQKGVRQDQTFCDMFTDAIG